LCAQLAFSLLAEGFLCLRGHIHPFAEANDVCEKCNSALEINPEGESTITVRRANGEVHEWVVNGGYIVMGLMIKPEEGHDDGEHRSVMGGNFHSKVAMEGTIDAALLLMGRMVERMDSDMGNDVIDSVRDIMLNAMKWKLINEAGKEELVESQYEIEVQKVDKSLFKAAALPRALPAELFDKDRRGPAKA
jgi:hypothetical protein